MHNGERSHTCPSSTTATLLLLSAACGAKGFCCSSFISCHTPKSTPIYSKSHESPARDLKQRRHDRSPVDDALSAAVREHVHVNVGLHTWSHTFKTLQSKIESRFENATCRPDIKTRMSSVDNRGSNSPEERSTRTRLSSGTMPDRMLVWGQHSDSKHMGAVQRCHRF